MLFSPRSIATIVACNAFGLALLSPATAQIVTETVQPDRLDEAPLPSTGREAPTAPIASTRIEAAPQTAQDTITTISVVGSSLPEATFAEAIAPFIGAPLDAGELRKLADAVSAVYADTDIALYTILVPQQDFSGGEVKLAAIENHIDEVILSDTEGRSELTRSYAAAMAAARPLTRSALERYLILMNAIPGARTTPRVLTGDRVNTVKVALDTKKEPIESELAITTRGAARLGRTQLKGSLYLNGWSHEGAQTRLTVASSSDFERYLSASAGHSHTFGPSGTTLSGTIGYVRTRPEGFAADGDAVIAGVQTTIPVVRTMRRQVTLGFGMDGVDSENALFGQVVSNDSTRVVRASVQASNKVGKTTLAGGASFSQGLDALGADITNRTFASARFTKVSANAVATRPVGDDWRVTMSAKAQYSRNRLPGSELVSFGGDRFGRAFETGAVSGDSGIAAAVEMARTLRGETRFVKGSELYAFADRGQTWFTDRPGIALPDRGFASAGAGLRIRLSEKSHLNIEAARPIDIPGDEPRQDDWRLAFSVRSSF